MKMTVIVIAALASLGGTWAGETVNRAQTLESRRGYEAVSYQLPVDKNGKRELDVCRALAAAITQTVVLGETRVQRLTHAEEARKTITERGHRLTVSYSRDLYTQQCYVAVGPRQKWKTVNGFWAGSRVNSRAIARALAVLRDNGVTLKGITISVSSERHLADAKRLVARLRLARVAVVGIDKTKPNHATVRFDHKN